MTWIRHARDVHRRRLGFGLETIYLLDSNSSKIQSFSYDLAPHVDRLTERTVDAVLPTNDGKHVLVQFSVRDTRSSRKIISSFDIASTCTTLPGFEDIDVKNDVKMRTVIPNILPESISSEVALILSFISQSRLVFLSLDFSICAWQYQQGSKVSHSINPDAKVSSTSSATKVASKPFKEVFFLPSDWASKDCGALCTAWRKERSILFPRNREVRVVRCVALA